MATLQAATTLAICLSNQTNSDNVYAYITGSAISQNMALFLLESDGQTPYYPSSPSSSGSPLEANCAILLGAPGSTKQVTIPQITNGRVWFSLDSTLTFTLNPGPVMNEPSVTNSSNPNYHISWDFCELTFTGAQLYANISYVDFVCLPIALQLTNTSGHIQAVTGIPQDGLDTICSHLQAQNAIDGAGWSELIVTSNGTNLRALSPTNGISLNSSLFFRYFEPYVKAVWSQYTSQSLTIDTQAMWNNVSGQVSNGVLNFNGVGTWSMPATADIFNCSTGPFTNTSGEAGNISARLCAGFNRSTLLLNSNEPDDEMPSTYYQSSPTNHYARIVHATNLDGEGYAFPYDDVGPPGGPDLSGFVGDSSPKLLTITVGGGNVTVTAKRIRTKRFLNVKEPIALPKFHRRQVKLNGTDTTAKLRVRSIQDIDLEKGGGQKLPVRQEAPEALSSRHRSPLQRYVKRLIDKFSGVSFNFDYDLSSLKCSPIIGAVNTMLVSFISASTRAVLGRAFFTIAVLLFYLGVGHTWNTPGHQEPNRLKRLNLRVM